MAAMSRKHFETIANAVCYARLDVQDGRSIDETFDHLVDRLAIALKNSNANFNQSRFVEACKADKVGEF